MKPISDEKIEFRPKTYRRDKTNKIGKQANIERDSSNESVFELVKYIPMNEKRA